MTQFTVSKFSCFVAGAAVAAAGFFLGSQSPALHAQPAKAPAQPPAADAAPSIEPFGVSIPNGGAAVIKGRDGYAYIVDSRGLFIRAAQSGKGLELP